MAQQRRQDRGLIGARCTWESTEIYPTAVDGNRRPVVYRFMWRDEGAACACWKPDERGRQA